MEPDLIERFLTRVPAATRGRVSTLAERAPDYVAELRASVRAHVAECRARNEDFGDTVDVPLAAAIGEALEALLALDPDHDIPSRRVVTAAVAYFVDAGDDDPDFGTADGLVSDAEVVIAAAEVLGQPALAGPVRATLRGRTTGG